MYQKFYLKGLNSDNFLLIAGPCVVENKSVCFKICDAVKTICDKLKIPYIFKSSYMKANRTSGKSFRGLGMDKALGILQNVKKEFGVPVLTDVHSEAEIKTVSEVVDVLQIPAFLSRQTELLEAAGRTGKVVNIKKGQFLSPNDMKYQAEKVASTGNNKIMLTERGTFFGYNNLVVDMRSLPYLRRFGYPVIYDATHSIQMPSASNGKSGGAPEYIPYLTRAAAAAGVDGFFIETHPNPDKALSDGSNMLPMNKLENLLKDLQKITKLKFES